LIGSILPAKHDLLLILEAAHWGPTAHNMQNFDILVVDDNNQLEKLLNIEFRISEDFLRENYQQLSFSRRGADPRESRNSSEQCPHHRGGLLVIGARLHVKVKLLLWIRQLKGAQRC